MDTFKRAILMRALEVIETKEASGICDALLIAHEEILGDYWPNLRGPVEPSHPLDLHAEIMQAFPEYRWDITAGSGNRFIPPLSYAWTPGWRAPRRALLQQLLSDNHGI